MENIDTHDCCKLGTLGVTQFPLRTLDIDAQGWLEICQLGMRAPGRDASQTRSVAIAGPPYEARRPARELGSVLPSPAPQFQHMRASSLQERRQHRPDWFVISVERRCIQTAVGRLGCFHAELPDSRSAAKTLAAIAQAGSNAVNREMDSLHDPLIGYAGAKALEQLDLNMIERVDIGKAVAY